MRDTCLGCLRTDGYVGPEHYCEPCWRIVREPLRRAQIAENKIKEYKQLMRVLDAIAEEHQYLIKGF